MRVWWVSVAAATVALSSLAAACGTATGNEGSESRVTDPVRVTMVADDAAATTASIGRDGGTVDATGSDGTRYHLVVPPGAVPSPTDLGMAPLQSLTGLPPETDLAFGVRLSPDGQIFARPAWLYVEVPTARRVRAGVAIDGDVAALRPIGFDGTSYVLPVAHFSGSGALGFPTPDWNRHFPPSPQSASLQGDALDLGGPVDVPAPGHGFPPGADPPGAPGAAGNDTPGGGATGPSLTDGMDPSGGQGSGGGGDLEGDLAGTIEDLGNAQLTGNAEGERRAEGELEKLKGRIRGRVDELADQCIEEKDVTALADLLRWQAIGQLIGYDDENAEQEYQQAVLEACNQFEMQTYGESSIDAPPVFALGDSIDVKVPLKMAGAGYEGTADAPMKSKGYERGGELIDLLAQGLGAFAGIDVPNDITKNDYATCTVSPPQGQITAVATGLLADGGPSVVVSPGVLQPATVTCTAPPTTFPVSPFITDPEFMMEAGVPGASPDGLVLQGWEHPEGGKPLATKEIHVERSEAGATVKIGWHFTIEHTPGPRPKRH